MWRTLEQIRRSFDLCNIICKLNKSPNSSLPAVSTNKIQCFTRCSFERNDSQNRDQYYQRYNKQNQYFRVQQDWLDAIGWSGVALLSWYIVQPYRCRKSIRNSSGTANYRCPHSSIFFDLQNCHFTNLLSKILVSSTASSVLPIVRAVKPSRNQDSTQFEFEEKLRLGCQKLQEAHDAVSSALLNFLGTESMQNGNHDEAFVQFSEAAEKNNTAAIFNLGICYEMGLGTKQSFCKAAELYKRASDLGHATAMYNLGVFFVHGWGGMEASVEEARKLFTLAAALGQPDAQKVIKPTDKSETVASQSNDEDAPVYAGIANNQPGDNDGTDLWLKVLNINLTGPIDSKNIKDECSSSDSGVNMTPADEVALFFDK